MEAFYHLSPEYVTSDTVLINPITETNQFVYCQVPQYQLERYDWGVFLGGGTDIVEQPIHDGIYAHWQY